MVEYTSWFNYKVITFSQLITGVWYVLYDMVSRLLSTQGNDLWSANERGIRDSVNELVYMLLWLFTYIAANKNFTFGYLALVCKHCHLIVGPWKPRRYFRDKRKLLRSGVVQVNVEVYMFNFSLGHVTEIITKKYIKRGNKKLGVIALEFPTLPYGYEPA